MATVILPDQPELIALASLASVPASKMAAAFNSPDDFFEHLTLEEVSRMQAACERWAALQAAMLEAMSAYVESARKILGDKEPDAD